MSSRLLTALKYLLTTVVVIVLAWLAVCVVAMFTGHTDVLPAIGGVLVDLIEALDARPGHDGALVVDADGLDDLDGHGASGPAACWLTPARAANGLRHRHGRWPLRWARPGRPLGVRCQGAPRPPRIPVTATGETGVNDGHRTALAAHLRSVRD